MRTTRLLATAALLLASIAVAVSRAGEDDPAPRDGKTSDAHPSDPSEGGTDATPQKRRRHPLYDDRGALDWRTRLAEAQALAEQQRKIVFIEYGRPS